MKKFTTIILTAVFIWGICACGAKNLKDDPNTINNVSSTTGSKEQDSSNLQHPDKESDTLETTLSPKENPFEEEVELIMYSSGSSGQDTAKVMEEFNKLLKEKCNTTINVTCLGLDNYENQYNLILTSGEKADILYVNPNLYNRYAATGAFMDVTELFPEFMPKTYALFSEEQLNQAKVDGHLYMIPSYEENYGQNGIFYRLDLAEKYDLAPISSMETLEAYLDTIAQNEKELRPIDGNPEQTLFQLFKSYYGFENIAGSNSSIIMVKNYDDINNIVAYPFTDEYLEWAIKMKEWRERGFWSSNALSSTMDPWSSIQVGTSAITQANADGAKNMMRNMEEKMPETTCAYWSLTNLTGYSFVNPVQENGFAIPASSPNAKRTLQVLELIKNDSQLFDLWMYGIEGYHFDLNENGELIRPAKGQDPSNVATHSMSGAQYAMRTKPFMRQEAGSWEGYNDLISSLKAIEKPNKFGAVALDYTEVSAELAAVNQVVQQYGYPINIGLADDVEKAVEEYREQLKAAGIDDLLEEITIQMNAYYEDKNIQ